MTQHYGIIGNGEVDARAIQANLDDLIDAADDGAVFHLAMFGDSWGGVHDDVLDHLVAREAPIWIVHDAKAAKDADLKVVIEDATESVKVVRVAEKLVADLVDEGGTLLILWDTEATDEESKDYDENDPGYAAFDLAFQAGMKCLDLTNGLEVLEAEGEEEEAGEPEEAPRRGRESRAARSAAATKADAPFPSEADLRALKRPALKELADKAGLELSDRAHTPTIVDTLNKHYRALEKSGVAAPASTTTETTEVAYGGGGISSEDFDLFRKQTDDAFDRLADIFDTKLSKMVAAIEEGGQSSYEAVQDLSAKFESFTDTLIKSLSKNAAAVEEEGTEEAPASVRRPRVRRT